MADPNLDRHPLSPIVGGNVSILPWRPARVTSLTAWNEPSLARMIEMLVPGRIADGRIAADSRWGRVWWTAPRRALVVADSADRPELEPSPDHAVHHETAAHVGFRVEGEGARQVLARLVPIDLADRAFPADGFATTRAEGVTLRLQRRRAAEGDGFDLLVARSQGVFFAEILADAAEGFGIAVPPGPATGLAAPRLSSREVFGRLH